MDASIFDFVTPKALRKNIVESVKFANWLWTLAQEVDQEYKDEMVRTIILYNISITEALLLFRAKQQKIQFYDEVYLNSNTLPKIFQHTDQELIIAYRDKKKRDESRVWFNELIRENKIFLGKSLNKQISDLQSTRNTFHLSRARSVLSITKAEESFDIVLKLINKLQKEYSKK